MNTKELEFIKCLYDNADSDNVIIITEDNEDATLSDLGISGNEADTAAIAGFYVYGKHDWQMPGYFPQKIYSLNGDYKEIDKVFYFSPHF